MRWLMQILIHRLREMYFSARYAPGGYAWIIPLGQDIANVGVGVRASYLAGQKIPLDWTGSFANTQLLQKSWRAERSWPL